MANVHASDRERLDIVSYFKREHAPALIRARNDSVNGSRLFVDGQNFQLKTQDKGLARV